MFPSKIPDQLKSYTNELQKRIKVKIYTTFLQEEKS